MPRKCGPARTPAGLCAARRCLEALSPDLQRPSESSEQTGTPNLGVWPCCPQQPLPQSCGGAPSKKELHAHKRSASLHWAAGLTPDAVVVKSCTAPPAEFPARPSALAALLPASPAAPEALGRPGQALTQAPSRRTPRTRTHACAGHRRILAFKVLASSALTSDLL